MLYVSWRLVAIRSFGGRGLDPQDPAWLEKGAFMREKKTKIIDVDEFLRTTFSGFTREDIELVQRNCGRGPMENPALRMARITADMLSTYCVCL